MYKKKRIETFCTGCGICHSAQGMELVQDKNGFMKPECKTNKQMQFCEQTCPGIRGTSYEASEEIWGFYKGVYLGYAQDDEIRHQASSGGILTSFSVFLIEEHLVDGIIHVGVSEKTSYETQVFCSRTKEEIMGRSGSRYSISTPLADIIQLIRPGEKYAFIGKPCDVFALKQYMKQKPELEDSIFITCSFFCAGVPSHTANKTLIKHLTGSEDNCKELTYRGYGWPGYAVAVDESGKEHKMSYEDSWGKILGRDVNYFCKFCVDGIGESADIACGDAWYCNEQSKPDFTERPGRNVIFARSAKGKELLHKAEKKKVIYLENFESNLGELKYMQPYQWSRKTTMLYKLLAMKVMWKPTPKYSYKKLMKWQSKEKIYFKIRVFIGTAKRILLGRL